VSLAVVGGGAVFGAGDTVTVRVAYSNPARVIRQARLSLLFNTSAFIAVGVRTPEGGAFSQTTTESIDPADASIIASVDTVVVSPWVPATVVDIDFPETDLGAPGTSFFIGAWVEGVADFLAGIPATYDPLATAGESWWIASYPPFDPNDLAAGALEYGRIGDLIPGFRGDWYLRLTYCGGGHCGESADLDGNGVPDECDEDCNRNGLPDGYDIAQGTATDCNASGVPDSCESLSDCDGNGVADWQDIAAGAEDRDRDGQLDACERSRGDVNLNGTVNQFDLFYVLGLWDSPLVSFGDADGDGEVSGGDIALVLLNFGT